MHILTPRKVVFERQAGLPVPPPEGVALGPLEPLPILVGGGGRAGGGGGVPLFVAPVVGVRTVAQPHHRPAGSLLAAVRVDGPSVLKAL